MRCCQYVRPFQLQTQLLYESTILLKREKQRKKKVVLVYPRGKYFGMIDHFYWCSVAFYTSGVSRLPKLDYAWSRNFTLKLGGNKMRNKMCLGCKWYIPVHMPSYQFVPYAIFPCLIGFVWFTQEGQKWSWEVWISTISEEEVKRRVILTPKLRIVISLMLNSNEFSKRYDKPHFLSKPFY